jgi:hypothetical protein
LGKKRVHFAEDLDTNEGPAKLKGSEDASKNVNKQGKPYFSPRPSSKEIEHLHNNRNRVEQETEDGSPKVRQGEYKPPSTEIKNKQSSKVVGNKQQHVMRNRGKLKICKFLLPSQKSCCVQCFLR